jgi:uncharacterized protein YyaL (SSP411 family)
MEHTNRLAREKSPYLLQHARNPVDWFAWSGEAFEAARREDKPVFLSVGYSTCHWCHVMERESFEDERVGKFLNEHFVSIKVDREERPDVDKIYMTFVQATTGGGGWPMSVFLTPDLKPFYGGTYFPPEARFGRPGFLQLLQHIAALWREKKKDIVLSAGEIHARLEAATGNSAASDSLPTGEDLKNATAFFKQQYDPQHGGFGGAPKFPQPSVPLFLLRMARRFADADAARMVRHTCERMAAGGIHDQLDGGFARYSVDAEWLVPHFEKMLYDNAQLAQLYLDMHLADLRLGSGRLPQGARPGQASNSPFAEVVRDILDYVLRDMTDPGGGFYSAEDADSEGHEGKFYCWTREELSSLLSPEEFNVAVKYFGITAEGNFVDHSHPKPLTGQNVLSIANPAFESGDNALLASARRKMFEARSRRERPHRDDKVLASWNGLMLGAFARAGAILGEEKYLTAAEKNLKFILEKLWQGGTLYHRWRDGEHDRVQLLEGYAFLLSGVIELYEVTLQPEHLDFAIALAEAMLAKFHDPKDGGFWQSDGNAQDLILRVKDDYDGAEPSGNSVAAAALYKLGAITGREDFRGAAEGTLRLFADRLRNFPQAMPFLLHVLDFSLQEPERVVIAGERDNSKFRELLRAAHSVYEPNKIILGNLGAVEEFVRTLPAKDGPMAYLCAGQSCQPPTNDAARLREMMAGDGGQRSEDR